MRKFLCLCAVFLIYSAQVLAAVSPSAIIYFDFNGSGTGHTDTQAVENAVRDAENKAAAQGYGNCQLKRYSYYPDTFEWVASATVRCSKDTTPPPPPPPNSYDPPTIFPPVRDGNNHIVSWSSPQFARFALYQSINGGSWREVFKDEGTSWTAINPSPATYTYKVTGIAGDGGATSAAVSITVSAPPPVPSFPAPTSTVKSPYEVSWGASAGADQYVLEQEISGGWTSIYVGPNTFSTIVDASPGLYRYRVKACANTACSQPSPTRAIRVVAGIEPIINYLLTN
jgi:hypothetical protein